MLVSGALSDWLDSINDTLGVRIASLPSPDKRVAFTYVCLSVQGFTGEDTTEFMLSTA